MKVQILMSTYNGGRYLMDQLRSVYEQQDVEFSLLVRDDGSSDATRQLLDMEQNLGHLRWYSGLNLGPAHSFMDLLSHASDDADFYMFCDQDDVWLPTKVADSLRIMLEQLDWQQLPIIVGTDLRVVDEHLCTMAESFWRQQHYALSLCNDRYFHLVYNNIPGCTMLFNRQAREVSLPCPAEIGMHDSWLMASVLWKGGRVVTLDEPTILYRQHGTNVLGSTDVPSFVLQCLHFVSLWQKVRREWRAVRQLAHIGFLRFLAVKMYFMMRLHMKI